MKNSEKIKDIIDAVDMGFLHLNDWENNFVNDMYNKILEEKELTWPMIKKIIEIWEKIK